MEKKIVSFVVPVFNASSFLMRCVSSLQRQTCISIEIILVDDGSDDGSRELCDAIAQKDSHVKVYHQKNQGVSAARNKGIELAQGKYIAFVDADDWIDPNVCEVFAEALKSVDYDLFCYSAVYHGKKDRRSFLFCDEIATLSSKQKDELRCKVMAPSSPNYESNCNTRCAGSAWGKFYRTEILKRNNFLFSTRTIISEDVLFNILALDNFEKIGYTTKVFYHYWLSSNSAQNRYRKNSMKYFEFLIDEIQNFLSKTEKNQWYFDCANSLFVHYLFGALKEDYFHKDNPNKTQAMLELKNVLNQNKFQNILSMARREYFSLPERILITLMKKKNISTISFLMRLYRCFS